jgi:hypothetical protein
MEYAVSQSETSSEQGDRIGAIFRDIEKKARLAGNTSLLLEIDRIPFQMLGASNRIPRGALDAANAVALNRLQQLTSKGNIQNTESEGNQN